MSVTIGELTSKFAGHTPTRPVENEDSHVIRSVKSDLIRSEIKLKIANENIAKLLPLAIELAMLRMIVASDTTLETQWDQLQVMVKLMEPDFFSICDRMVSQQRMDILEKFVFTDEDEDE
jgi:hypothetical protein